MQLALLRDIFYRTSCNLVLVTRTSKTIAFVSLFSNEVPVAVIGVSVPPTAASSSKPNPATLEEATAVAVLSQFQSTAELSNPQQPPPLAENSSTDLEKNSSHLLAKPTGQPKDDANYNALAATATRTTTIVTERPDNAKSSSSGSTNTQNTPPYRKAKNFAERLMIVLQDELAKDSLWWVGNGMGVAIHKKNLKRSPILKSHFNIGDFIVFSRNLNRWYVCSFAKCCHALPYFRCNQL